MNFITKLPKELIVYILQISSYGKNRIKIFDLSVTCKQFNKLKFRFVTSIYYFQYPKLKCMHFNKFKNLRSVELGDNTFVTDRSISKLVSLTSLGLMYNKKITDKSVSLLTNLTFLNLYDNGSITDNGISKLHSLTSIYLPYNHLITVKCVSSLTNLKRLCLRYNNTQKM